MDAHQSEIITDMAARYELPPNRYVEIHQSRDTLQFTALVTQGDCSVIMPGFPRLDKAIEWARQQWPDHDVIAKEVTDS